jgi:putative ABC transport system ATP-binding protein
LRGFDIDVKQGEFVTVTGPSGSGKTTFLNIAGLLEEFDGGEYTLDGVNVKGLSDDKRSRLRNEKARLHLPGVQPDSRPQPLRQRRRAAALPRLHLRRAQGPHRERARRSRARFAPPPLPAELSGGQQQRVAIARALAGAPPILLADEPTGNLDSQMARSVMELMEQINAKGTTIIMVTHDPELAMRAQRNVHIIDGRASDLRRGPSLVRDAATA